MYPCLDHDFNNFFKAGYLKNTLKFFFLSQDC